jgi:hypothetical protein
MNFSEQEIETMRVECYRHWVAHFGTPSNVRAAGWDGCWDEFPRYGWKDAETELVIEYYIKQVKPVQPERVA